MDNAVDDQGNADTTMELEEADDLIDIHFAIVNDEADNLEELCGQVGNLDGRFLDDLDAQHLNMTPLALAAALNKPQLCKILLKNGANVDATFASLKTTALMTSSFHGHPEVVAVLLGAGSDARRTDAQRSTALGYCFGGSKQQQVVEQLLQAGVDVNLSNVLGMNAFLLVSGYGNPKLLYLVLDSGAKVDGVVNNYGHTPLHLAVLGKLSQVNILTQKGVYNSAHYGLNRRNLKQTFVEWARSNAEVVGEVEVGERFEKVGQLMEDLGTQFVNSRFSSVELLSDEEQLKQKVDAAVALRRKRLSEASITKKNTIIDSILSCGGKRNKQAGKGKAGKDVAVAPAERPVNEPQSLPEEQELKVEEVCSDFVVAMVKMTQAGCNLEGVEHTFALTPLDIAILNGDVESSALLLSRGADPDHLMATLALSDLYESISALRPDKKHIKDLLDHDKQLHVNHSFTTANIPTRLSESENEDMIGDSGLTPLAVAAKCRDNSTTEVIKMLTKHGADMNGVGVGGRTPLGEACRWGNVKMVEFLINQGADVEQANPAFKHATPVAVATISRQPAVVQLLISKGAKIDMEMSDKRTPLISAIDCEDMAMVDRLLQADPVLNCHNKNSLDHQMLKLYQSPNKDIRVILQEISKRAAEIKAEEEEEEDEVHRSQVVAESTPQRFQVYESIPLEKGELETRENVKKTKKRKSKKTEKVEEGGEKEDEVEEEFIVPQIRKALEPQEDMPIYSQVNKHKKTSHGNERVEDGVRTSSPMAENILGDEEIVTKPSVQSAIKSDSAAFDNIPNGKVSLEENNLEGKKLNNEGDGSNIEVQAESHHFNVQQLEEALNNDLLEDQESHPGLDEASKGKKKKIKKKPSKIPAEETIGDIEPAVEAVTTESVTVVTKKKTKKKTKEAKNDKENIEGGEVVSKEEVVDEVEAIVDDGRNEDIKPKIKKKKSHKKKNEAENDEVNV